MNIYTITDMLKESRNNEAAIINTNTPVSSNSMVLRAPQDTCSMITEISKKQTKTTCDHMTACTQAQKLNTMMLHIDLKHDIKKTNEELKHDIKKTSTDLEKQLINTLEDAKKQINDQTIKSENKISEEVTIAIEQLQEALKNAEEAVKKQTIISEENLKKEGLEVEERVKNHVTTTEENLKNQIDARFVKICKKENNRTIRNIIGGCAGGAICVIGASVLIGLGFTTLGASFALLAVICFIYAAAQRVTKAHVKLLKKLFTC